MIFSGNTLYRRGCLNPTLVNGTSYDYLEMYYEKAMKEISPAIVKETVEVVISIVYHILLFFFLLLDFLYEFTHARIPSSCRETNCKAN